MAVNTNATTGTDANDALQRAAATQIPNIVPTADAARASALSVAGALLGAQQSSLTIQRARTVMLLGTDADAVARIDERAAAFAAFATDVGQLQTTATIQPPEVPAGSAAIFGQVTDANGAGVKGAAVLAIDASGKALRKASSAADGGYQLVIPIPAAAKRAAVAGGTGLVVRLQVQVGGQTVLDDGEQLTLNEGDTMLRMLVVAPPDPGAKIG